MNPLARMLISLGVAFAVYAIYWLLLYRKNRIPATFWARSADELKLRATANGWLRILAGWILAFVAYAFVIEDSGELFTWYWLRECLLKGDWIGVLLIASILTLCERYLAKKRMTRLQGPDADANQSSTPTPANN